VGEEKYSSSLSLSPHSVEVYIEFHFPFAILEEIKPTCPLSRRLGGCGHYGQKKNLLL
jgi:hypothetical protein